MDLSSMRDAFQRVSKKQKLSNTKTQDVLDRMIQQIENTAHQLLEKVERQDTDCRPFLVELQARLTEMGAASQIGAAQKEVNVAVSKYGKVLDKVFNLDISKGYREIEFDASVINKIVALHFYRQGLFDLGDCFVQEAQQQDAASLKAPFYEMHQILERMKRRDVKPALEWAGRHREELEKNGSSLQLAFKLHQLQFVHLLHTSGRSAALKYARGYFEIFAGQHMTDIQRLMGCLLWAGRLESSPYSDLLAASHWDAVAVEFTRECCNLLGQAYESPLHVVISAGSQALPTLLKLATVMANKKQEWLAMKQLPVEIELDNEFQFHSIFACPVSKEQSTADNPPMLMPCGHVLCKQSIHKLAKGNTRIFKCPYCPLETTQVQCRQIYL